MTTKEQRATWLEMRDKAAQLFEHGKDDAIDQGRDVLALLGYGALRPLCEHVEALEAENERLRRLEAAVLFFDDAAWLRDTVTGPEPISADAARGLAQAIAEARAARKP